MKTSIRLVFLFLFSLVVHYHSYSQNTTRDRSKLRSMKSNRMMTPFEKARAKRKLKMSLMTPLQKERIVREQNFAAKKLSRKQIEKLKK